MEGDKFLTARSTLILEHKEYRTNTDIIYLGRIELRFVECCLPLSISNVLQSVQLTVTVNKASSNSSTGTSFN